MSDNEAGKTTINVKGVRQQAWDAARRSATQANDTMGTWLSEAIDCRIARDSGSVKPDNPPMTHDQITARIAAVAALQQSAALMRQAGTRGNSALRIAVASMEDGIIRAESPRLISGKDRAFPRQSVTNIDVTLPPANGRDGDAENEFGQAPGSKNGP